MSTRGPDVEYTPEAVLSVFNKKGGPKEPLTSSEIAEELDCSSQTARNRLNELSERGELKTKKVGARGQVWWLP